MLLSIVFIRLLIVDCLLAEPSSLTNIARESPTLAVTIHDSKIKHTTPVDPAGVLR